MPGAELQVVQTVTPPDVVRWVTKKVCYKAKSTAWCSAFSAATLVSIDRRVSNYLLSEEKIVNRIRNCWSGLCLLIDWWGVALNDLLSSRKRLHLRHSISMEKRMLYRSQILVRSLVYTVRVSARGSSHRLDGLSLSSGRRRLAQVSRQDLLSAGSIQKPRIIAQAQDTTGSLSYPTSETGQGGGRFSFLSRVVNLCLCKSFSAKIIRH